MAVLEPQYRRRLLTTERRSAAAPVGCQPFRKRVSFNNLGLDDDAIEEEEAILSGELGRIRDVRQGPDGAIYVLPDTSDAMLYSVEAAE